MSNLYDSTQLVAEAGGNFDVNAFRPYFAEDGKPYISRLSANEINKLTPEQLEAMAQEDLALRVNNATLRRDEWKAFDDQLLPEARVRLPFTQSIISAGLTYSFDGYSATTFSYEDINDVGSPFLGMEVTQSGNSSAPEYSTKTLPLPIWMEDWYISDRKLTMSRKLGQPLDTTRMEMSRNSIDEAIENMFINGTDNYSFDGNIIYGLVDTPNKISVDFGDSDKNWAASDKTGTMIRNDVLTMKQELIDQRRYGSYSLLIPTAYETVMDKDYDTAGASVQTIREAILRIDRVDEVIVVDKLPANTVILYQKSSDIVRLLQGMPMTNIQWQAVPMGNHHFKTLEIAIPQIRATQGGYKGVVVMS